MYHSAAIPAVQRFALVVLAALLLVAVGSAGSTEAAVQILTVDTAGDTEHAEPNRCTPTPGNCSLRDAINEANATVDADVIQFNIPGDGQHTITTATQLPYITSPVTINGGSEPKNGTCAAAGVPCIVLNGPGDTGNQDGLVFQSDSSVQARGLGIVNYVSGIWVFAGINHVIEDNYLGTTDGITDSGNSWGVYVEGGQNIDVGTAGHGNVISGNTIGVHVESGANVQIGANYIGTNAAGDAALGNNHGGVELEAVAMIGGEEEGEGNVISGNGGAHFPAGVRITGAAAQTTLLRNYIGTNAAGDAAIPNNGIGVWANDVAQVFIGNGNSTGRNLISGDDIGIRLTNTTQSIVDVNRIGANAAGNAVLSTALGGIGVDVEQEGAGSSTNNVVGGNQIVGNGTYGIRIAGMGNSARTNLIGTDPSGTEPLGSFVLGVKLEGSSNRVRNNVISVTDTIETAGMIVGGDHNYVFENFIGVSRNGDDLGGALDGIRVESAMYSLIGAQVEPFGEGGHPVGGASGVGNTIRNAANYGVWILGGTGNTVSANSIYDNGSLGIALDPGSNDDAPAPVLLTAATADAHITGTITGAPDADYRLEFFASPQCDASGFGEGRDYLGTAQVTANNLGVAAFDAEVEPFSGGESITATTSVGESGTSEFSNCVTAVGPTPTPSPSASPAPSETLPPTATASSPTGTPGAIQGDADCDGEVTLEDMMAILEAVATLAPAPPCPTQANANCDDAIDEQDALLIALYAADVPAAASPPCPPIGT